MKNAVGKKTWISCEGNYLTGEFYINGSINQSINQSMDQINNQSINQSIND